METTEHCIAYAYPSSDSAQRMGRGSVGCYMARSPAGETAHDTYAAALASVHGMGTAPNRWSMDHPSSARFLHA